MENNERMNETKQEKINNIASIFQFYLKLISV